MNTGAIIDKINKTLLVIPNLGLALKCINLSKMDFYTSELTIVAFYFPLTLEYQNTNIYEISYTIYMI